MNINSSNIDQFIERSRLILEEVKELEKERSVIAKGIGVFLCEQGLEEYRNGLNVAVLFPTLSPHISELPQDDKDILLEWVINNFPKALQINNTALVTLLKAGHVPPVQISLEGSSVRVWESHKLIDKEIRDKPVTVRKKKTPTTPDLPNNDWSVPNIKEEAKKEPSHLEKRQQLVEMQVMWESGETYTTIGKKYKLYPTTVKKKLKPFVDHKMREMRAAMRQQLIGGKGDIKISVDID